MSTDTTIRLIPVGRRGLYSVDPDGDPWWWWYSYEGPSIPCSICGTHLLVGYRSSARSGNRRTVCVRHVEWRIEDE